MTLHRRWLALRFGLATFGRVLWFCTRGKCSRMVWPMRMPGWPHYACGYCDDCAATYKRERAGGDVLPAPDIDTRIGAGQADGSPSTKREG